MRNLRATLVLLLATILGACVSPAPPDVTGAGSQLAIREAETREYDTLDKAMTMRSVISTLQDLGFVIDSAELTLGVVTATRLDKYTMRMTVTVREKGARKIAVRANARIGEENVTNPATYQDFFADLDKAMFLTLNKVD